MKFTVGGAEYEMVQDNITFAEARAIEKVTGKAFQALMSDPNLMTMDVTQALAWVSMKRVDPTLTFSDLDEVEIRSVAAVEEEAEAAPEVPTVGDVDSNAETTSPPSD